MKRLAACGASAIFQITRAFRRGEIGPRHNPEFTIVEWYRTGATYHDQMDFVEELVAGFFERVQAVREGAPADFPRLGPEPSPRPFERLTYDRAFEQALGRPVLGLSAGDLARLAESIGVDAPPGLAADDVDGWLNLLLALRGRAGPGEQAGRLSLRLSAGAGGPGADSARACRRWPSDLSFIWQESRSATAIRS